VPRDFFVVLWDSDNPAHAAAAARIRHALANACGHLTPSFFMDGLHFYSSHADTDSNLIHLLANRAGIVFGTLFRRTCLDDARDALSPRADLRGDDTPRILQSGGRYLIEHYWGHYVAILADEAQRTKWVLRSPACHQPCLWLTHEGVRLYFSSVEDCAKLNLLRLTINWDVVAAFSAFTRVSGAETGLNEILELSTGEYHIFSPPAQREGYHWNPADLARCQWDESLAEARRLLRATVRSCVFTWAAEHANVVQRLSGGLDSSIAAACLSVAPSRPRVTCLNYYSPGAYGDERKYARAVSARTGLPLIEYPYDSAAPMDSMLSYRRTMSPASYLTRSAGDLAEFGLARRVGASARFTGILGDVLFHMPPAAPTVADYIRRRGVDRGFFRIAHQSAQIDDVSIWKVLRAALMDGLFSPPSGFMPGEFAHPDHSLLTREARDSICHAIPFRFVHPWLHNLRDVPFGKFPLIASLSWNSANFSALSDPGEPDLVHPFFSEPLVELCLRLPTYSLLRDGWDRALAREAFESELPDIVKSRISKGSPNLHVRERIEHNQEFIRDMLTDSVLVKQGILDRRLIDEGLPGRTTRSAALPVHLWACVAAEAWSRAWLGRAARSAK
jgi:asparagine synthase (glutamine-hydrolysing)